MRRAWSTAPSCPVLLQAVNLSTCNLDLMASSSGLRKWPMHVEQGGMSVDNAGGYKRLTAGQEGVEEGQEASAVRKTNKDEAMDESDPAGGRLEAQARVRGGGGRCG